jgi:hypothetical protein
MDPTGLALFEKIAASVDVATVSLTLQPWSPGAHPLRLMTVGNDADLRTQVAAFVYAHYYAFDPTLLNVDADQMVVRGLRWADAGRVEQLRKANPARGYWNSGWIVREADPSSDELIVHKNGISLTVLRDRHLAAEERQADVGATVSVRFPKESLGASPGFYLAYGEEGPPGGRITRFYLNLRPDAVAAIGKLLRKLLAARVRYTLKVLSNLQESARRDNTVLYVSRSDYERVLTIVEQFHSADEASFHDAVPGFTLPIMPGVAVADNPLGGMAPDAQSFGEHRSLLVAAAITQLALEQGSFDTQSLYDALLSRFRAGGLDPARPHLDSAEAAEYGSPVPTGGREDRPDA